MIRDRHVTTVFFETLASPDLARSLAGDLGISTGVLDPIEGLTSADSHATYLSLMRQNLAAIAQRTGVRRDRPGAGPRPGSASCWAGGRSCGT